MRTVEDTIVCPYCGKPQDAATAEIKQLNHTPRIRPSPEEDVCWRCTACDLWVNARTDEASL